MSENTIKRAIEKISNKKRENVSANSLNKVNSHDKEDAFLGMSRIHIVIRKIFTDKVTRHEMNRIAMYEMFMLSR